MKKITVLISYAYARNAESSPMWDYYINSPHVELLLDCGAFTAKTTGKEIKLEDYCAFLDRWKDRLFAYLALDVVGNPKETDSNLKEMIAAGYKPVPVHVLGDTQKRMDELFEMSDYVALAGLKRPGKGHCSKGYVQQKMQWAKGRNVHWLGYVVEKMIGAFKPYSVDSSSWGSGFMYGYVRFYHGNGRWSKNVEFHNRHLLATNEIVPHLRRLGFTIDQFNDRKYWRAHRAINRRSIPNAVGVDSWVRYVLDIKKQYGSRVFMACNLDVDDGRLIKDTIEGLNENQNLYHGAV